MASSAYPRSRWEREGSLPFDEWGPVVDGPGTPWEEWLDVDGLVGLLAPARFELVFSSEWHNNDFNWFDLLRMGSIRRRFGRRRANVSSLAPASFLRPKGVKQFVERRKLGQVDAHAWR